MTKKHFVAIASIIRRFHIGRLSADNQLVNALADYFQTTNKEFDRTRFLAACGMETEVNK